ncbi:MAG: iron chelate uptake ABC transporter family permease subunit [Verrucomicrobiota bacterium]
MYVLISCVLLGISFGLLGCFIVVRKMALVGDTLSHAVLPGVAAGYLWGMSKNPAAILIGATLAGLLGTAVGSWIKQTTKLKQDAAMGMVLASFFAVGLCLISMIQRLPTGNKAGLKSVFFGKVAAMGPQDLMLMSAVCLISLLIILLLYRPFLASSFDPVFARSIGYPVRVLHHLLMFLLAMATVVALQAVGAVMVSAMLITPAATAYLLTKSLHRMLWLASGFGVLSGLIGVFVSFLDSRLPTGPCMALCAGLFFVLAFLFSPEHGIIHRRFLHLSQTRRIQRENTLKAIYRILERSEFQQEGIALDALAVAGRATVEDTRHQVKRLVQARLATMDADKVYFTPSGKLLASKIVRNHRLWELYLTETADYQADHVHDDAEKIEHLLGEETVRRLEKELNYPSRDPHGKPIPNTRDLLEEEAGRSRTQRISS